MYSAATKRVLRLLQNLKVINYISYLNATFLVYRMLSCSKRNYIEKYGKKMSLNRHINIHQYESSHTVILLLFTLRSITYSSYKTKIDTLFNSIVSLRC